MDSLLSICVTTIEEASAYLNRPFPSEDSEKVAAAVNGAAVMLERLTGRKLGFRTYRDPVTVPGTAAANSAVITSIDASQVEVGDGITAPGLRPDPKVIAASGNTVTMDKPAIDPGAVEFVFGSAPELIDGPGFYWGTDARQPLYASEYPVVEVFDIVQVQSSGDEEFDTSLDLTGMRLGPTGRIVLPNAAPARGDLNLELHYSAGLRLPSADYPGDADAVIAQNATHRLAQVIFQDSKNAVGRRTESTLGQSTFRINDFRIPDDVALMVELLRRQ